MWTIFAYAEWHAEIHAGTPEALTTVTTNALWPSRGIVAGTSQATIRPESKSGTADV